MACFTASLPNTPRGRAWGSGPRTNRKRAATIWLKKQVNIPLHIHNSYPAYNCLGSKYFYTISNVYSGSKYIVYVVGFGAKLSLSCRVCFIFLRNESMGQIDQIHEQIDQIHKQSGDEKRKKEKEKGKRKRKTKRSACTPRTHVYKSKVAPKLVHIFGPSGLRTYQVPGMCYTEYFLKKKNMTHYTTAYARVTQGARAHFFFIRIYPKPVPAQDKGELWGAVQFQRDTELGTKHFEKKSAPLKYKWGGKRHSKEEKKTFAGARTRLLKPQNSKLAPKLFGPTVRVFFSFFEK